MEYGGLWKALDPNSSLQTELTASTFTLETWQKIGSAYLPKQNQYQVLIDLSISCQPWINKPLRYLIGEVPFKYQIMTIGGIPPN
jgi:hypothetical protein